jgi:hypothetical protein
MLFLARAENKKKTPKKIYNRKEGYIKDEHTDNIIIFKRYHRIE